MGARLGRRKSGPLGTLAELAQQHAELALLGCIEPAEHTRDIGGMAREHGLNPGPAAICGSKPVPGAISSSFHTRSPPKPMRAGS